MRKFRGGVLALGLVAAFSGIAPRAAYAGDQQCYYGLTDPVNSCAACMRICLGSG
jgi:hypothetical protein